MTGSVSASEQSIQVRVLDPSPRWSKYPHAWAFKELTQCRYIDQPNVHDPGMRHMCRQGIVRPSEEVISVSTNCRLLLPRTASRMQSPFHTLANQRTLRFWGLQWTNLLLALPLGACYFYNPA